MGSSKPETDAKLFTAVIPPLAAGPPMTPLPPTPPKQCPWEDIKPLELLGASYRNSRIQPKVEVVVGVIKDVRVDKKQEKQKRGLRRVKGNIGAATHDQTSDTVDLRNAGLGPALLLTPRPTSPPMAKPTTPPRTLHRPKPYKLPMRKLHDEHDVMIDSVETKKGPLPKNEGYDDDYDDDDDEDGGIALDYEYEPQMFLADNKEQIPETLGVKIPSTPGVDIPRLDSPFLPDVTLCLDKSGEKCDLGPDIGYQSHFESSSEDEGVKLSACRKSLPEIVHPPIRIDSLKVEVETEPAPLNRSAGLSASNENPLVDPTALPTERTSSSVSLIRSLTLGGRGENTFEATGAVTEGSPRNQRGTLDVDIMINKSSILKKRLSSGSSEASRDPPVVLGKPCAPSKISNAPTLCKVHSPIRNCSASDSQSIFTPPQLPRFNFIPATPLPLMSPTSILDKQLGEQIHKSVEIITPEGRESLPDTTLANITPAGTRPEESMVAIVKTTRPLLLRSKTLRDSRLHPWWRPRPCYKSEEADLAKLLENTKFGPASNEPSTIHHTPPTDWTEYGPLKVDKKRKIVGLGGVQIQWVGLGSWYERLVGRKQETGIEEGERGKLTGHKVNLKRKGWTDS